jgi:flagellar hook-length control protein FliK
MNLSSYLQMPPAPLTPNSTSTATPQGPRTGAGTSAGGSLGFDFAQVMARQMERLVPQERQTFAADVPKQPETRANTQDSRLADTRADAHAQDRQSANRAERDQDSDADASDDNSNSRAASARQRGKAVTQKTQHPEVDALLAGLMQGAPVASLTPAAPLTATANASAMQAMAATTSSATTQLQIPATLANSAALQSIQLSPQMRIITDPQKAPSPESLAAFAKSMGLDESAIQNLLAKQPTQGAAASNTGLTTGLTPLTPNPLQASIGAMLGSGSPQATSGDDMMAMQLAAMAASATQTSTQTSAQMSVQPAASGAGLAAAATTLVASAMPGLTPTDMAAIQQLQITVMPAAVLPVNTNANQAVPSTLDMLSLMGTGIDEQDVEALLTRFTEESGAESNPEQQSSSDEGQQFGSFAQSLARNTQAATANAAAPTQATASMSEVYDQLSDKMATEMAARMHKQLSDGEWKMKFALRPSNLGGVEIQLEMKDGKLDAVFHADNPLTRDLLQNSSQRLREALGNFGINAGQVNVGQGGGNTSQNGSGNSGKQSQVRDNSSSQVNGSSSATSNASGRNKANASLLDLYA